MLDLATRTFDDSNLAASVSVCSRRCRDVRTEASQECVAEDRFHDLLEPVTCAIRVLTPKKLPQV